MRLTFKLRNECIIVYIATIVEVTDMKPIDTKGWEVRQDQSEREEEETRPQTHTHTTHSESRGSPYLKSESTSVHNASNFTGNTISNAIFLTMTYKKGD